MAPVTNGRVLFNSIPKGKQLFLYNYPIPGKTTVYDPTGTIDVETHPLNGGFLVKTLVVSVDPGMRVRMRNPEEPSYVPAFKLGETITGFGIGIVVRSENSDVAPGKHIYGMGFQYQEYFVLPGMAGFAFLEKDPLLSWTVYTGAAGLPGKTAYMGWKKHAHAKRGETVFVTAGAGPVGFAQIPAPLQDGYPTGQARGLKVVASAGSDEKVQVMHEVGADVAFNYKTNNTREVLAREGPIDIYWDNVGGDVLDAAIENAAIHGRVLLCGMVSGYNTGQQGIQNLFQAISKTLTISGVTSFRLFPEYEAEFYATVPPALARGELKYKEHVAYGLEKAGDLVLAVQTGANTLKGKAVIVVAA
ncbi:NAD-P-binding protein [Mycena maculata]|uniref:NAD-P-binding protein n=1 Tax=Mycena maculata TaxID=230809 RepID=A0AAD7H7S9_9AGAR|nr:NAD-P-binding protein [Mycena maculata]